MELDIDSCIIRVKSTNKKNKEININIHVLLINQQNIIKVNKLETHEEIKV